MGNKNLTSTSTPNPAVQPYYSQLLQNTANLAQTPYTPFTGQGVAPVNQQQQQGIGNINQYAQAGLPYLGAAGDLVSGSANPLTAQQIQQYYNPYQQQVVGATEAQFNNQNAIQQQQVLGNAAAQGALGGNRTGIAQATLAGQQQLSEAPVIAGLESQGYQQALGTAAQQYQQNPQAAAYALGNIGQGYENAALTGANAQVGAGTLEQQTQQAGDVFNYQQYLNQLAYPFQTNQYAAGVIGGIGSLEGGQTTTPGPSLLGQLGGLGLAGAGIIGGTGGFGSSGWLTNLFNSDRRLKEDVKDIGKTHDGQTIYRFRYKGHPQWHIGLMAQEVEKDHPEAVGDIGGGYKGVDIKGATDEAARADGGPVGLQMGGTPYGGGGLGGANGEFGSVGSTPYSGGTGYIPGAGNMPHGSGPPQAPNAQALSQQANQGPQQMMQQASQLSKMFGGSGNTGSAPLSGLSSGASSLFNNLFGQPFASDTAIYYKGGPVRAGMGLSSFMPRKLADGGTPDDALPPEITQGVSAPPMAAYQDAIAANESGGNYSALGKVIARPDGSQDRAYGKYQVMGANIPQWTTEALGQPMTPQQFAASPEAQDAVFQHKFGQYVDKYGPEGAARAWFAGEGGMNNPNARDVNGTSVDQYGQNFTQALGFSGAAPSGTPGVGGQPTAQDILNSPDQQYVKPVPPPSHEYSRADIGQSLLAAGLGMMASGSHFPLQAIGQGGLQGVAQLGALRKQEQEEYKEAQNVNESVARLNQQANFQRKNLAMEALKQEQQAKYQGFEMNKPYPTGQVIDPRTMTPVTTYSTYDPATQKWTPINPGPEAAGVGLEQPHGDDYLKTLPSEEQQMVKQVANGDVDLSKVGFRDRTRLLREATNYDPSFNTYTAPLRATTAKNFTGSGVEARNFQSNQMAVLHLGEGLGNVDRLNNFGFIPGLSNRIYAMGASQVPSQYRDTLAQLQVDVDAVGNELMRSFRGSGSPSEKEAMAWKENFPVYGAPDVQRAAFQEGAKLLGDRITSAGDRYNDAMGPAHARDPYSWIHPDAQEVIKRAQNLDPVKPWSAQGAPATAPAAKVSAPANKPQTIKQNGHTYTLQSDGTYK